MQEVPVYKEYIAVCSEMLQFWDCLKKYANTFVKCHHFNTMFY